MIDLIHAAGFRHGALMAQQKWAEINNQLTQYLQLAAEKLKEYQEQKQGVFFFVFRLEKFYHLGGTLKR